MLIPYTTEELLLDESFVDYCLNKNSTQRQKWEDIIARYPAQQAIMEEAKELLLLLRPSLPEEEIATEVAKIRHQLQAANTLSSTTRLDEDQQPTQNRPAKKIRQVIAYSLLAILVAGTLLYFSLSGPKTIPELATFYQTKMGERSKWTLPDGSVVILNSNSRLTLNSGFNKTERRVELAGEAFFEVAKDPSRPFIVSSDHFSTTAIGTAFYIDASNASDHYSVNLLEGKVKINSSQEESLLKAGEKLQWKTVEKKFVRTPSDTVYLRRWLSGNISFKKMPAVNAFSLLEEWYGVKIDDRRTRPADIVLNGDYSDESLEDVLKVICFSLSCQYLISEDSIVIQ